MDLSIMNRHSPRNLAIGAVLWSCFGGFELGQGLQLLLSAKGDYHWIAQFLFGPVFLALGIFWAVMLVRRVTGTSNAVNHRPPATNH